MTEWHDEILREARAVTARIEAQKTQVERLRSLADRIESQIAIDSNHLKDLEGILGESKQLDLAEIDEKLGGQRLERVALRLLEDRLGIGAEIHYREWFEMIRQEGYVVGGKNPLGTFLALLNRSNAVEPVGGRSGKYRLRIVA